MNRFRCLAMCIVAGVSIGCGGPKPYVQAGFLDHPPRRVAVLPFVITYAYDRTSSEGVPASHVIGRDVFRKTLYYGLTPYGYADMKLSEVDRRLAERWGPIEEGAWRAATPQQLGEALGVDAVVYGEIGRIMHFSTPLYTETSLSASLRMVEVRSGEELWRQRVKVAERGGALMKKSQVVDFVKDQIRSFKPEVKFLRICDVAVRRALKGLPNPPASVASATAPAAGPKALRLAVLPLQAKRPQWHSAASNLRQGLGAALQESPFDVVEPGQVDAVLKTHGWSEGAPLPEARSLAVAAAAMGADVMLRGTVTDWGRTYAVVESWVKAAMAVELVDASSGDVIWSGTRKNTRHAGILKGPTGFKAIATAPITGLKTSNLERVATHLSREMVDDMTTAPAVMAYVDEHGV